MSAVREIRRRASVVVGPTMAAMLAGYFLLHTFQGDRGLFAWMQLRQRVAAAEAERDRLHAARLQFEARTRQLSNATLDPDLLDERVRAVTGLGRPDEFVIEYEPKRAGR